MDNFGGAVPLTLAQVTSGYNGPGVKAGDVFISTRLASFPDLQLGDQVDNYSRQLNIVDNLSWVKGAHELRFGIDWRRLNSTYGPVAFGQEVDFTREPNIISSKPNYMALYANQGARPVYDNYSAYAQDTWKLSPRLTMELGMRWEMNPAPRDANGLRPIVLTGINGADVSNVSIAPPSAPFYRTFKTAFAPRAGIAYALNQRSGRETVLRGGFGVYYDLGSGMASSLFGGYPFFGSTSLSPETFPVSPDLVQPPAFFPLPTQFSEPGIQSFFTFFALDPNLQLPYTLQWNVAVEQSLGKQQTITLSYVASAARKLTTTEGLNQLDYSNPLTQNRPNPNIGNINYVTNGPTADYRSLQARYQRRFSQGLQALVNYTWSHAVDEVSNDLFFGSGLDRGNADFDVRHNFSAAVTYDFPKLGSAAGSGAIARFVKAIANGWSLDSIFFARTGMPLDLVPISSYLIVRPDGTSFNLRPDLVPGQPFWISDPTVPGGQRLNPAAFATPPRDSNPAIPEDVYYPLRQGTLKRNAVYLPGIYQLNMAVRRQFNLGERLKLQLKAEAFNVFNHPLFAGYGNNISYSDLGVPSNTLSNNFGGLNKLYQTGGPRSMQFSLRLSF